MAKKTTTTRGKTKTAKKTAAPKKPAKSTSKKAVKAAPAAKRTVKLQLTPVLLQKISLAAHALLAVLTVALMAPVVFPLTLGYLTKDTLLSNEATVFVPAERIQFDLELRWALFALMVFAAIYSLLLLTRWRKSYDKALAGRVHFWRWVYLAVNFMLLTGMAALLSGVYDVLALKLISGLTAAAMAFAWISERQNEKASRPVVSAYVLGLASLLAPWVMIGGYTLATTVYGLERLPWFVYALEGTVLVGAVLTFVNLWMSNVRAKRFADYVSVERGYLVVNALVNVASAVILIVGLSR